MAQMDGDQPAPQATAGGNGYHDWAAAFQHYYAQGGQPPQGYYSPAASTPQPHPYMWGGQHMIPPYGTPPPPPYGAMYPPGAMYGHPSMAPAQQPYMQYGMPSANGELSVAAAVPQEEVKPAADSNRDKAVKRMKSGSMQAGHSQLESGKGDSPSANGVFSQSGGDDDDDDDEGDDDDDRSNNQQHGGSLGGGTTSAGKQSRGAMMTAGTTATGMPQGQGLPPELWLQDEREVKRQRRKQSNRESARRSRLRKQAECEELSQKVDGLNQENSSLRGELTRLHEECLKLQHENETLQDQLHRARGNTSGAMSQATQAEEQTSPKPREAPQENGGPEEEQLEGRPSVEECPSGAVKQEEEGGNGPGRSDAIAAG